MSQDAYNFCAIILGAATLLALLFYTYYTRQLLLTSEATTRSTQKELEIMQEQLTLARATTDATRKELEILREQLVTARQVADFEQERELRIARPIFVWTGGAKTYQPTPAFSVNFQNHGGPIAIVETVATNCAFGLSPANYIAKEGTGVFNIGGTFDPSAVSYLGIKYVTGMNEVQTVVFRLEPDSISPRVDAITKFEGLPRMPSPPQPVDLIPFHC